MNLYFIRQSNGEATILMAENEKEAIQAAGLDGSATANVAEQMGVEPNAELAAQLNEDGLGPRFVIKKLDDFCIALRLDAGGDFEVADICEATLKQLYSEYPAVDKVLVKPEWVKVVGKPDHPLRRILDAEVAAAIEQERVRLLLPGCVRCE